MANHFEDKNTYYAYGSINDFFGNFGLSGGRSEIESILKAAVDDSIYKKENPAYLLSYMKMLEDLCSAAFVIHHSDITRAGIILEAPENNEPNMSVEKYFLEKYYSDTVWDNFPRSLTAKQYHNPYKALKKFCTYMAEPEWKKILKELTEYALSDDTIDEIFPVYNILTVRKHLLQLIEACHLIIVRSNLKEVKQKGKQKKQKTKK